MMKKSTLFLMGLFLAVGLSAQDLELVGTVTESIKPRFMAVDDQQIYIAEPTTVHIFTRKGLEKVTQFGKAGSGPEEFMAAGGGNGALILIPQKDQLVVSAMGKINHYQKNGRFIKTTKVQAGLMGFAFYPLGTGYVGASFTGDEKNGAAMTVNVYNDKFNKLVELNRMKFNPGGGNFNPFDMMKRMAYVVDQNRIYQLSEDEKSMVVRSDTGEKVGSVILNLENIPLPKADIDAIINGMLRGQGAAQAEQIRKVFAFPDHYPVMMNMIIDNGVLYLTTWKKKGEERFVAVYDIKTGLRIKDVTVPIHFIDGLQPFPFTFWKGYFYGILEVPDEDEPDEVVVQVVRRKIL
jgi:hypothetical protein